ncbi:hypothetical protein PSH81_10800 [Pseudomonas sp. FP2335]|uniref:hypothetical protein n=1 Tax=Pseudomonas sp. FP2335 TaxID=2954092 RepID=UPI002733F67A|nr:hypothetical protein [Pseudomonas sp. FP2335]WLH81413.1 hypothetical protein PSH81_10800 [Pseudomonas sp. FP2335]
MLRLTHHQHQAHLSTPEKTITIMQMLFQQIDTLRLLNITRLSDNTFGHVVWRLSLVSRTPQLMTQKMVGHQERHQE